MASRRCFAPSSVLCAALALECWCRDTDSDSPGPRTLPSDGGHPQSFRGLWQRRARGVCPFCQRRESQPNGHTPTYAPPRPRGDVREGPRTQRRSNMHDLPLLRGPYLDGSPCTQAARASSPDTPTARAATRSAPPSMPAVSGTREAARSGTAPAGFTTPRHQRCARLTTHDIRGARRRRVRLGGTRRCPARAARRSMPMGINM